MDNMDLTCGHFVNPFTDIGFKIIFGQPASKELLITLLNELLAGEHRIENLIFLDKENHSDSMADAGIIYDLYCLTDTGEYIIVEMQNRFHSSFLDRTLFYMCRAIGRQVENLREKRRKERELQTGKPETEEDFLLSEPMQENYGSRYKLSTVYGIFLMNFREPGLEEKFRTDTVIADRESGKVVNPHFRQIFLQFPYFTKELKDCETLYDKLIYTLKNMQHWNRMPDALKEQVLAGGALAMNIAGSGPSVFALASNYEAAVRISGEMKRHFEGQGIGCNIYAGRVSNRGARIEE